MGVNKFNMKKIIKKSKIDKHGLCLNEYENNFNNAKIYFDRATGKSPEMEVSKAIANILKPKIKNGSKLLDVGCACGHYYRSIKKRVKKNFFYTGTDPYEIFLDKAKIAWKNDTNVNFLKGNIYKLPFKKNQFDLTICSNVFIHLNKIKKPLQELLRVTKGTIIIRTVVYDVSYKVQLVYNNKWWKNTDVKPKDEFDKKKLRGEYNHMIQFKFDANDIKAFSILGVSVGLKWEQIQGKFKTLVKKFNPDINLGNKEYEEKLKLITLAYTQLKNTYKEKIDT